MQNTEYRVYYVSGQIDLILASTIEHWDGFIAFRNSYGNVVALLKSETVQNVTTEAYWKQHVPV